MVAVYAIYNQKNNKIYIGQTVDLEKRLHEHNNHTYKGYTASYDGEWVVIYTESLASISLALIREKQLKSFRGREFIKKHIPR